MSKEGRKKYPKRGKQLDLDDGGACSDDSSSGAGFGATAIGEAARYEDDENPDRPEQQKVPELSTQSINDYFKAATTNFERMIKKAVDSLIERIQNLEKAVEYQSVRGDELEKRNRHLEEKMEAMEKEVTSMKDQLSRHAIEVNKAERFSRRNNFRIVGVPEARDNAREDCPKIVEKILKDKFGMDAKVERSHRDGKRADDRPRHILVKMLSYREKTEIMKNSRKNLAKESFYIIDDLTKPDLEEKKKWRKEVKDLYAKGTKLRFFAGKWRINNGIPYNF